MFLWELPEALFTSHRTRREELTHLWWWLTGTCWCRCCMLCQVVELFFGKPCWRVVVLCLGFAGEIEIPSFLPHYSCFLLSYSRQPHSLWTLYWLLTLCPQKESALGVRFGGVEDQLRPKLRDTERTVSKCCLVKCVLHSVCVCVCRGFFVFVFFCWGGTRSVCVLVNLNLDMQLFFLYQHIETHITADV